MTDNTEPTIDGEVRNIIGQIPNYVLGYLEISDGIKQEWADHQRAYLQIYSDRITKLISDQVAKARIEETKLYKQYFKGRTQGYANARIDVLEKELATKRSKE